MAGGTLPAAMDRLGHLRPRSDFRFRAPEAVLEPAINV